MQHYTLHHPEPKAPEIIYDRPRVGLFALHTGEWGENGWIDEPTRLKIVGEDELCYIQKFQPYLYGMWVGNAVVPVNGILALGVHKSRLIRWETVQLNLFVR